MDTCNNSSSSAAAAADSLLENLISGETMEGGGEDETLEWLSIYVEDCLSGATHYSPAIKLPPAPNSRLCFTSLGGPAVKPRSKRRRIGSFAALRRRRTSDTPSLLPQSSWLAESELIVLPPPSKKDKEIVKTAAREEKVLPRKCSHCLSQKTPQWRAGPLGPKTLCNACGVRFRSGRLLPEYRPAKSPTFETYKHSNSHKKVMEMRMALMSSDCS